MAGLKAAREACHAPFDTPQNVTIEAALYVPDRSAAPLRAPAFRLRWGLLAPQAPARPMGMKGPPCSVTTELVHISRCINSYNEAFITDDSHSPCPDRAWPCKGLLFMSQSW